MAETRPRLDHEVERSNPPSRGDTPRAEGAREGSSREWLARQAASQLQDALRARGLYPARHPTIEARVRELWESVHQLAEDGLAVEIDVEERAVVCGDLRVDAPPAEFGGLLAALHGLGVGRLGFGAETRLEDARATVETLGAATPGDPVQLGEDWKEAGIQHVWYRERVGAETIGRRALRVREGSIAAIERLGEELRSGRVPPVRPLLEAVEVMRELVLAHPRTALSLAMLEDDSDPAGRHATNVALLGLLYGRQLGLPAEELGRLGLGGLLHDVGEMRTPASVRESPGGLTAEESRLVQLHPQLGVEILQQMPRIHPDTRAIVLQHHVRLDGSGYPTLPSGTRLHPFAEAIGLLECYEALTSRRPYQRPHSPSEAIERMRQMAGRTYSRELVDRVVEMLGAWPVGETVRLVTGEIAVVVGPGTTETPGTPLRIVIDASGQRLRDPIPLEIPHGDTTRIVAPLDPLPKGIDVPRTLAIELGS